MLKSNNTILFMLAQCRRRWDNIEPTLGDYLVLMVVNTDIFLILVSLKSPGGDSVVTRWR